MSKPKRTPRVNLGSVPDTTIGKAVWFGSPGDVKKSGGKPAHGVVVDEIWVGDSTVDSSDSPLSWGKYQFVAQRIKWDAGHYSIRLGYYRQRVDENHWEFAGQTTITSNPHTMRALLEQTLAKSEWFE